MDEAHSPMLGGLDFEGRLDDIERRLSARAADPLPEGRTDPDPDTPEERWQAAQVWAHIAEFVGYWHAQMESVIAEFAGEPVPFGRVKSDPARIAAIEVGRHEPIESLIDRARRSIGEFRRFLVGLGAAEWNAVGIHQTIGRMGIEAIVERFVVAHLEEHLDQLEGLAEDSR
jgi:hypothetical protein